MAGTRIKTMQLGGWALAAVVMLVAFLTFVVVGSVIWAFCFLLAGWLLSVVWPTLSDNPLVAMSGFQLLALGALATLTVSFLRSIFGRRG